VRFGLREPKVKFSQWKNRAPLNDKGVNGGGERGNPEQIRAILEPETLNIAWKLSPHLLSSLIPLRMRAQGI